MDCVEQAIQSALEAIPAKAAAAQWQGETPWTIAVKTALVEVGHEFGWLTAASQCESANGREWLYDVVWYQLDQAIHLTAVPLVAESEWGGRGADQGGFREAAGCTLKVPGDGVSSRQ